MGYDVKIRIAKMFSLSQEFNPYVGLTSATAYKVPNFGQLIESGYFPLKHTSDGG